MYIICVGTPTVGFKFIGPYDSKDDARMILSSFGDGFNGSVIEVESCGYADTEEFEVWSQELRSDIYQ